MARPRCGFCEGVMNTMYIRDTDRKFKSTGHYICRDCNQVSRSDISLRSYAKPMIDMYFIGNDWCYNIISDMEIEISPEPSELSIPAVDFLKFMESINYKPFQETDPMDLIIEWIAYRLNQALRLGD